MITLFLWDYAGFGQRRFGAAVAWGFAACAADVAVRSRQGSPDAF
jgi:hypothetical protein